MCKRTFVSANLIASIFASSALFHSMDAWATEFGTTEQAKAMLERAVIEMRTNPARAIDEFNFNRPAFRDRDLFVFCFNGGDGKYTADEAMIGRDVRAFRDAKGQPFGRRMYEVAAKGKVVNVDYLSPLPGTTELAVKRVYLARVGDQVCGVSAFLEH